jgi:hypothetical protein
MEILALNKARSYLFASLLIIQCIWSFDAELRIASLNKYRDSDSLVCDNAVELYFEGGAPGSYLGRDTGYPGFPRPYRPNTGIVASLGDRLVLPDPYQLWIIKPNFALYILDGK